MSHHSVLLSHKHTLETHDYMKTLFLKLFANGCKEHHLLSFVKTIFSPLTESREQSFEITGVTGSRNFCRLQILR